MEGILREYSELLAAVDHWFGRCVAHVGSRIHCSAGCSACCRGLFDITLLDAALLKQGFNRLAEGPRHQVLARCRERLAELQRLWPGFDAPYLLNDRPEADWEALMPDEDETPCPLLGDDGKCLVYDYRPMTCRLHGLPLIDLSGEVMHDEWCSLNYPDEDPLSDTRLTGDFEHFFRQEAQLIRCYAIQILGREFRELDTLIPTALLIDFDRFDWRAFAATFSPYRETHQ